MESKAAESEVKRLTPTPTFPKFSTPTPQHKVNEVWRPRILQQLTLSGNRGAQQEFSVSRKVLQEIVPIQQEFPT